MNFIKFIVDGQKLNYNSRCYTSTDTIDTLFCSFKFEIDGSGNARGGWNLPYLWAQFHDENGNTYVKEVKNNICSIPYDCLRQHEFKMTLFATDTWDYMVCNKRYTTNEISFVFNGQANLDYAGGVDPDEPVPSHWEVVLKRVDECEDKVDELSQDVSAMEDKVDTFDGRITANENDIEDLNTRLANESNARANGDTRLEELINAESTSRANADAGMQSAINNRYTKAETDSLLDAERTAREASDTNLQQLINNRYTKAETDALLNAKQDSLSTSQMNAVNSGLTSTDKTTLDNLSQSVPSMQDTMDELSAKLANESTARANSDARIEGLISAESTARENTDADLRLLLDDETNERSEAIDGLETEIADVKSYIGYSDDDIYGVEVDFTNRKFTRLAGAVNKTPGADFDDIPCFHRRRCNVDASGNVTAYYGDDDFTTTGENASGTKVQVMVEQPRVYYKVVPITLENAPLRGYLTRKIRYYVTSSPKPGFKLYKKFEGRDAIYLSAFEASLFDASADTYILDDAQVADFTNDHLSSIGNAKPISGLSQNLTRANARKLASNLGSGWSLSTPEGLSITQMLFLIEYATFNMQTALGVGVTNKRWDGTNNSEITGATVNLGNGSGSVTNANGCNVVSYRGEENPFGNIWKWLDGMNEYIHWDETDPDNKFIDQYDMYINLDGNYTDNTGTGYDKLDFSPATTEGYISAFGYDPNYDFLFIPAETRGNSSLPVGDYYYRSGSTGWRVALFGGVWNYGASAGGFYLYLGNASGVRNVTIGARLEYAKPL